MEKQGDQIIYIGPYGAFERSIQVLTDEQLQAAPGWAYLPVVVEYARPNPEKLEHDLVIKTLDGNQMLVYFGPDMEFDHARDLHNYGDNTMLVPFDKVTPDLWMYVYESENNYVLANSFYAELIDWPDSRIENTESCYPVPADYDGDGISDLGLKCMDSWKIIYYDYVWNWGYPEEISHRETVIINLDNMNFSIPAMIFPGGISYPYIMDMVENYSLDMSVDRFTPYTAQCVNQVWASFPQCFTH